MKNLWQLVSVVLAVGVILFGIKSCRDDAEKNRLALAASNAIAAADTTRAVSWRAQKVLGDSIRAYERLVVQSHIENDALDNALHRASALITRLDATIQSLHITNRPGTAVTLVASDTTVRQSTFHVDSTPYHVDATAKLPPPPRVGSLDLAIRMDTVSLRPRLQCGEKVNNVRPATILVETPTWLTAKISESRVDPSACNPQLIQKRDWTPWWLIPIAFGAGVITWEFAR